MQKKLYDFLRRYLSKERIWEFFLKEKFSLSFFTLAFIFLLIKGILLIYPDINITYPFMAPDSYDWIANGLYYTGYDVNFSLLRPPGLPLIIALLQKINLLTFLPLVNQMILFGIFFVSYKIINTFFRKAVSIISISILFFNFFLQNISLFILADLYCLIFVVFGFYYYLQADRENRFYFFATLFWAISFLFQYAFVSIAPAFLIHFFIFRKKMRLKTAIISLLPFLILILGWILLRQDIENASPGAAYVNLLKPHFDSVLFYIIGIIAVFGIFTFILLVAGMFAFFLEKRTSSLETKNFIWLSLLASVSWIIFWIFLYDWNDRRFIVYLLPFLIPLIAVSINFLLNKFYRSDFVGKIFVIAIVLFSVIWSTLPYESVFSFDKLKVTKSLTLEFKMVIDQKTFKGNIDAFSFHLTRNEKGFSPINLLSLSKLRNMDYSEVNNLNIIRKEINSKKVDFLCIKTDNLDNSKLYILSNRYGNYFKKKVRYYPECFVPNLQLSGSQLQII